VFAIAMAPSPFPSAHPPSADTQSVEAQVDLEALKSQVLNGDKAQRMAEFFAVLGDPNRWRILSALAIAELRVSDLAQVVEMSESAVSHQLRVLRSMRFVGYTKQGRNVVYRLKDHHIFNLYRDVSEHLDEPHST
jgi:ArsR family transcriptional regulator, lead/cadmium/zinc/bismuth-responsive transcriptional repressor